MRMVPAPWHFSHRPPLTLNENRPALYPLALASGSRAKSSRMGAEEPDVGRGVGPRSPADGALVDIDDLVDVLGALDGPVGALRGAAIPRPCWRARGTAGPRAASTCPTRIRPVMAMSVPRGKPTSMSLRLCSRAPRRMTLFPFPGRRPRPSIHRAVRRSGTARSGTSGWRTPPEEFPPRPPGRHARRRRGPGPRCSPRCAASARRAPPRSGCCRCPEGA